MTRAFRAWLRTLDAADRRKQREWEQARTEEFEVALDYPTSEADCVRKLTNAMIAQQFLRSLAPKETK